VFRRAILLVAYALLQQHWHAVFIPKKQGIALSRNRKAEELTLLMRYWIEVVIFNLEA
jgi:hypothetical protein